MVDNGPISANIDTILIKVASRCNINCTYCYVYNMGDDNWTGLNKFMSSETIDALCVSLSKIAKNQITPFSVVLHGGEPLLLGSERLREILFKLRQFLNDNYPISIQSNGILISSAILDICSQYRASVAVSIDGPKHIHDKLRIKHNGKGTFDEVLQGISKLKEHPDADFLNAGMLAVIDPTSDPQEVYSFFKSIEAPSVDFLYKDGNHDRLPLGKAEFESVEYGKWMEGLLFTYLSDSAPLPIRVIDDMLKVLLGGIVSKEGMGVTDFAIVIIDTDGTVMKNDTLKSSYNGADKFQHSINVKNGDLLSFIKSAEFQLYKTMQRPSSSDCQDCPYLNICGGGMILHRWKSSTGFNNPSVYCADQKYLITAMKAALRNHSLYV